MEMCSMQLHVEQPKSGQLMRNTDNLIILCSLCSHLGAGQGNTCP
jgi:hypothetical protein